MNDDGLKAFEDIKQLISTLKFAGSKDKQWVNEELSTVEKELQIFALVNKAPGELGFILDCKDFNEYVETFTSIGGSVDDSPYIEEEFNVLKNYYRGDEQ